MSCEECCGEIVSSCSGDHYKICRECEQRYKMCHVDIDRRTASDTRRPVRGSSPGDAVLGPSARTGVEVYSRGKLFESSVTEQVYQSKKPSPLARALVKTRFPEFKGEIIDFSVSGPHGLKLEECPQSHLGCVLMRVVDPGALFAQGSAAPCLNDRVFAVNGALFPWEGEFREALENFPIVITILRENKSSPVEQQIGPDLSALFDR